MTDHSILFEPIEIRGVRLSNRVVVPPMVQARPLLSDEGLAWYRRLASGGAGMVIVEATGVPHFREELTVDRLKPLVNAIHDGGAAAAIQLFPLRFGDQADLNALTGDDIERIVELYGRAAVICRDAGFEAVEPHGAHGFLLNQFFMPDVNQRTDDYAGSLENRSRLAREIVQQIRLQAGEDLLIFYRHTPLGKAYSLDDSLYLARQLVDVGLDVLDVSPAMQVAPADLAAPLAAQLPIPVIAVNGMENPDQAARALRERKCDLVAVGRQMIADARWPGKVLRGALDEIRHCVKCDVGCFGYLRDGKSVACVAWDEDETAAFKQ